MCSKTEIGKASSLVDLPLIAIPINAARASWGRSLPRRSWRAIGGLLLAEEMRQHRRFADVLPW